mgnify:CR=1 FL=1
MIPIVMGSLEFGPPWISLEIDYGSRLFLIKVYHLKLLQAPAGRCGGVLGLHPVLLLQRELRHLHTLPGRLLNLTKQIHFQTIMHTILYCQNIDATTNLFIFYPYFSLFANPAYLRCIFRVSVLNWLCECVSDWIGGVRSASRDTWRPRVGILPIQTIEQKQFLWNIQCLSVSLSSTLLILLLVSSLVQILSLNHGIFLPSPLGFNI